MFDPDTRRHVRSRHTPFFAAVSILLGAGCTSVGDPRQPQAAFGPPLATAAAGVPQAGPGVAFASAKTTGPFRVGTVRADAGVAARQNWEVQLAVSRRDPANADGDHVVASWIHGENRAGAPTLTGLAMAVSTDGARSFVAADQPTPPGNGSLPFDPMLAVDPATGAVWRGGFTRPVPGEPSTSSSVWVEASPVSTGRFGTAVFTNTELGLDKGLLAWGPAPGGAGDGLLYLVYNFGVQRSIDRGATWSAPSRFQSTLGSPLFPHPDVLADGTLGVAGFLDRSPSWAHIYLRIVGGNGNAGAASTIHVRNVGPQALNAAVPGEFRVPPFVSVAVDPRNGRLVAVFADASGPGSNDIDVLVSTSDNGGRTWTAARAVADVIMREGDQMQPEIAIDRAGRWHLAWLDTRRSASDTSAQGLVDAWYARSDDGGLTWRSMRLTEQPLDSTRTNWSPFAANFVLQFVGDYIGLDVSEHAAYVAYPAAVGADVAMLVSRIDFDAAATSPGEIRDPRALNGVWFEPATSGQGFDFLVLPGDSFAVLFYGHRDDGTNLILNGVTTRRPRYGETFSIPLTTVTGGRFGNFTADQIRRDPWGTLTLRFDTCERAVAVLDGRDGRQTLTLQPLTRIGGLTCD